MVLTAIGKKIIVKRNPVEEKTKGGIILTDASKTGMKASEGATISVGKEVQYVKVGDRVVFSAYAGAEITDAKGVVYLILLEDEVLAVNK